MGEDSPRGGSYVTLNRPEDRNRGPVDDMSPNLD
jgi:hypothetical protein